MAGECIYLCSSTLSGHAVLLPNGAHNALTRMPLRDFVYSVNSPEVLTHYEELDKVYVDCGGSTLRTIGFSWRDHNGNLVPLGEHDWNASLCFGYPTT